jgi:hypothetical protein
VYSALKKRIHEERKTSERNEGKKFEGIEIIVSDRNLTLYVSNRRRLGQPAVR